MTRTTREPVVALASLVEAEAEAAGFEAEEEPDAETGPAAKKHRSSESQAM